MQPNPQAQHHALVCCRLPCVRKRKLSNLCRSARVSQAGAWTWLQSMGHGDMQGLDSPSLALCFSKGAQAGALFIRQRPRHTIMASSPLWPRLPQGTDPPIRRTPVSIRARMGDTPSFPWKSLLCGENLRMKSSFLSDSLCSELVSCETNFDIACRYLSLKFFRS